MSSEAAEHPSRTDDASPAEAHSTQVDDVEVVGALSPSRAGDFATCALLYRLRVIDRLPEPPSLDAARGTLVHQVLERLFDLPATARAPEAARGLVAPAWEGLVAEEPRLAEMFADPEAPTLADWLASAHAAVERYFDLEDPRRLEPAEREMYVEALLDSRLLLRGFVDRLDVSPDGLVRVVDYKTGRAPGVGFEARALFQMRFYALALWRAGGVIPTALRLVYLGSGEVLSYRPDEADLLATERKIEAIWAAISEADESGVWLPQRSRACTWCSFRDVCPEFGGTPPPLPTREERAERAERAAAHRAAEAQAARASGAAPLDDVPSAAPGASAAESASVVQ